MMDRGRDRQKLRRWCIRKVSDDWTVRRISEHARIPKSTVHDWWRRFQWKGWEGLVDASRALLCNTLTTPIYLYLLFKGNKHDFASNTTRFDGWQR